MAKSFGGTAIWTACSTAFKIGIGLLLVKLFVYQYGIDGLGQAANFMTLITVLGVFAGAGIFNGVTKYVAAFAGDTERLSTLFVTSQRIILCFSSLLAVLFILLAEPISQLLFFSIEWRNVVIATAFCQFGIAWSNYTLAILKGIKDAKATALSVILGALIGGIAFVLCLFCFGYQGALIGLILVPALTFIPAHFFLKKQAISFYQNSAKFSRLQAWQLSKFSVMVFVTAITLPLGYMILRNLLQQYHSLESVGLWQGVAKISDAYLQFITAAFSVYLLPTFAKLNERKAIQCELKKSIRFVAISVLSASLVIYALREWVILLLYTPDFLPMKDLFFWQLLGDICKVIAYVFGYLIVAKGALKLYILAEIFQFILLLGTGVFLIPMYAAQGATLAYFITYASYLAVCVMISFFYFRKAI